MAWEIDIAGKTLKASYQHRISFGVEIQIEPLPDVTLANRTTWVPPMQDARLHDSLLSNRNVGRLRQTDQAEATRSLC